MPNPFHGPDQLQVSRFETILRRILGIKASGLLRSVDQNVGISFDLLSDGLHPEYPLLMGYRRYGVATSQAASVGNIGGYSIVNPAGSKHLVIIRRLRIQCANSFSDFSVSSELTIGATFGTLYTTVPCLDTRQALATAPNAVGMSTAVVRVGTAAAIPVTRGPFAGNIASGPAASALVQYDGPVVLTPGYGVIASTGIANVAFFGDVTWEERPQENSEQIPQG